MLFVTRWGNVSQNTKKKTGASYLFNYRYSMTGLANQIGMIDMQGQVQAYDIQLLPAQYQL